MNEVIGPSTIRVHGRSLTDFGELTEAERKLLKDARLGEECDLGSKPPKTPTPQNTIRPSFLRFLLLGGDAENPVHERGIKLSGAFVGDRPGSEEPKDFLNLEGAKLCEFAWFWKCLFASQITLGGAQGGTLGLDESVYPSLDAVRMLLKGGLYLRGVKASGETALIPTVITPDRYAPSRAFRLKQWSLADR